MPIALIIRLVCWGAVAAGVLLIVDEIGDRREKKVDAKYAEIERKKEEAVKKSADEAEAAREPAFAPGSLARLKANWCRNCGDKP